MARPLKKEKKKPSTRTKAKKRKKSASRDDGQIIEFIDTNDVPALKTFGSKQRDEEFLRDLIKSRREMARQLACLQNHPSFDRETRKLLHDFQVVLTPSTSRVTLRYAESLNSKS